MKRVVVIGSKPNAVIPDGDAIYCANASIAYYADQIVRFGHIVNVITPMAIDFHSKQNIPNEEQFYLERWEWERMLQTRPSQLVILRSSNADPMIDALRKAGYDAPITSINDQERRKLVTKVSGCDDPILTADFFRLSANMKVKYAGSAVSIFLKRIFDQSKTCNAIFRPSTGIISLLYAIEENGVHCEYVVAGIGLKNRSDYLHGKRFHDIQIPLHVFADRKILQTISSRFNITSTEPELMGILPPCTSGSSANGHLTR